MMLTAGSSVFGEGSSSSRRTERPAITDTLRVWRGDRSKVSLPCASANPKVASVVVSIFRNNQSI